MKMRNLKIKLLSAALPFLAFSLSTAAEPESDKAASRQVSYTVAGKHIVDNEGKVFIPNGLQLLGPEMASSKWSSNAQSRVTQAVMQSLHDNWHANTTRLQLSSENLFSGAAYPNHNTLYLDRVDQMVDWATQLNMNIILSLQYEVTTKQLMPTEDSVNFWKVMAAHYANNPRVFFDIFNEPNPGRLLGSGDTSSSWTFWQNGGSHSGTNYVGMQELVNTVRATGANNLIIAEGTCTGACLDQLPSHLLSGHNIVYAMHPYFGGGRTNPGAWDKVFGNAIRAVNAPVVADEWGSYESGNGECVPDAPTLVPLFFKYLHSLNVGVIGWSFEPGTMIRGWDINNPTRYDQSPTTCNSASLPNMSSNAQGAGQLLQEYLTSISTTR